MRSEWLGIGDFAGMGVGMSMGRVHLIKRFIRLGMSAVPNQTLAYRLFTRLSPLIIRPLAGCEVDSLQISHCHAWWLACQPHCDARVVLYLHGGGYVMGSNRTHLELASRIARAARAQVLMLEYRLAPEHPYPGALDDALMAYDYLLSRRVDNRQIVLAGDSAGGGLAMALAMRIRDRGRPAPAGVACLSPWLDMSCSLSSISDIRARDPLITPERIRHFARQYAAGHDPVQPGLSPFFGELHDLPPILIQVGEDEILLPECRQFARRARRCQASVELQEWPGMFHVWQLVARLLPEARHAIHKLGDFIQGVTLHPHAPLPTLAEDQAVWSLASE